MSLKKYISKLKTIDFCRIRFEDLLTYKQLFLYAGDIPDMKEYRKFIGLSINQHNRRHIRHDVTQKIPLPDQSVDLFQSEDVFEHIEPDLLPAVINEIYRLLKPGGVFRLSLPDYQCDLLYHRTQKNEKGELVFDPVGGGQYQNGKVIKGGHVWFPDYMQVKEILAKTRFQDLRFYHYYNEQGEGVTLPIDYSIAYVKRTPDHDERVRMPYRPMSIVVDCIKE